MNQPVQIWMFFSPIGFDLVDMKFNFVHNLTKMEFIDNLVSPSESCLKAQKLCSPT